MEAIKKGMRLVTGNAYSFLDYMNWHDIMELAEKDKLKNYSSELLKEATVYENAAKDDDVIVQFWKVYDKLNREDRKLFFNFTGGRSHLADIADRFDKKLTIRVDPGLEVNSKPTSVPDQFALILPKAPYADEEKFKECLREQVKKTAQKDEPLFAKVRELIQDEPRDLNNEGKTFWKEYNQLLAKPEETTEGEKTKQLRENGS